MKKAIPIAVTLGLAAAISLPAQERPQEERGQQQQREQERARQDQHGRAEYHFRQEDGRRLRDHYKDIHRVDVNHRGRYIAGERLPHDWHRRMHPVPEAIIAELPPPPPGYIFGYIDGYCVVYDPNTGYIADVIDLADLP